MIEYTTETGPRLELDLLNKFQERIGYRLPDSYCRFLLKHNGGRPKPGYFLAVEDGEPQWMRGHFFFGIGAPVESCDLGWNSSIFQGRIHKGVIPIASDEVGNRFCLDLRQPSSSPVLFWDHEKEGLGKNAALSIVIATSFEEWIQEFTAKH
jgi:hypothetical protein